MTRLSLRRTIPWMVICANFVPNLIKLLKTVDIVDILKVQEVIKFFGSDGLYGERDEFLDYLCEVNFVKKEVHITLYSFKKELLFKGDWGEFKTWAVDKGVLER